MDAVPVKSRPAIGFDLDKTVHQYSKGWHDGTVYDDPISGALEAMRELSKHYDIIIHTARDSAQHTEVLEWLVKHGVDFPVRVTNIKPPEVVLFIDDRAIRFDGNWARAMALAREYLALEKQDESDPYSVGIDAVDRP